MPEKLANITIIMEFLLMGFTDDWMLQRLYAALFFLIYLMTLMGNLLIVTLTTTDLHLHAPVTEYALLVVMSYDRYAAICHPLRYETIMNRGSCVQMVTVSWLSGFVYGSIHVAGTFSVNFCGPNIVHQFFCDIPSLLTLACPGEQILEYAFIIASFSFAFLCFLFMIASYVHIFSAVLRIPSAQGRFKTVSTCMPHLTVMALFLFSGIVTYLGTNYKPASSLNLFMSVLYSVLPPSRNPVIYSLRNRDMKAALGKLLGGKMLLKM
ncbi:olfactory receptor 14A16-like [Loxodonta africana]|uniref:olfactory receptor 14A16-like n=1 Tax=Loxodonta africana TaxID=9785 RepID=UPI0030D07FEB